jgi:hypothetical protein
MEEKLKEAVLELSNFYGIEPNEIIYFLERNTSEERSINIPKTLRNTSMYLLENCNK